jgi:hypothetical protein
VADPVFLPTGDQLATQLVRGLLAGPTPWLGSQAATSLPRAADVEVSVPLRDDGVAEVQLSDSVAGLSEERQQVLSAQLVWTLRQVPGVEQLRITVGGSPLNVVGADEVQSVDEWPQYDPSGPSSRNTLFALDTDGALVEVGQQGSVAGRWGRSSRGLSDFSVDRYRQLVAGVDSGGQRLVEGPLAPDASTRIASRYLTQGRLSDPQWDRTGLLWVLDHEGGSTNWVVLGEGDGRQLPAGRLTSAGATSMAVSADGARVAAVVPRWDGPVWGGGRIKGPCVVVARVVRRDDSRAVLQLDREYALRIPGAEVAALLDVDWSSPSDVMVLADVEPLPPQPLMLAIDGSAVVGAESGEALLTALDGVSLATAGVEGAPTVVGTRSGQLSVLNADLNWAVLANGLSSPHYPS